jgi:hypothetical protein
MGVGWSAACVLVHLRPTNVVIRTDEKLVPGEVVEMEFLSEDGPAVRLMGAVELEPNGPDWTIALIEQCEGYQELRESLTLIERDPH